MTSAAPGTLGIVWWSDASDEQKTRERVAMMKKMLAIGLAALAAVMIVFGVVAYSYLKPAEAASGPIGTSAIA
jgi:hypothetical protein